ncbi:MAG: hypothetical protein ACI4MJ_12270 [Aristaeellaceae bacterium]
MLPLLRVLKRKTHFAWTDNKPYAYGRVADRNLRGERMTCSAYLPELRGEDGYRSTSSIPQQPSAPRRRRVDRREAVGRHDTGRIRIFSRDGVKGSAACVMLMVLFCTLGLICLVGRSRVLDVNNHVQSMANQIEATVLHNEELETQLAVSAAEVNVSYKAVQQGMISSKGVNVIYLTAPENADMILTTQSIGVNSDRLATILGN